MSDVGMKLWVRSLLWVVGLFILLIFGAALVARGAEKKRGVPTLAQEVDCVLVIYRADSPHMGRVEQTTLLANKHLDCDRVIVYPDSHVPVLIPVGDVDRVKALVGEDSFIRISPNME